MDLMGNVGEFGTKTRTNILLLIYLLEETHASELARLLGVRLYTVQCAVDSLEQAGLAAGVREGRNRRLRINPRYFAKDELDALLGKIVGPRVDLLNIASTIRRRPRRAGKKL